MMFVCSRCRAREPAVTRAARCRCGGLWDLEYERRPFDPDAIDRREWSLFRYRAFMGLDDGDAWRAVTMGEGMTPVIDFDEDLALKMDYLMPTGSFKDRGAAVLAAHCASIGVDRVVQDSSGNAGHAVAAYCARAGIGCEIFVPQGTSPRKIDLIRAAGAAVDVVAGGRDHCADVCRAKAAAEGLFYASHVYNPVFYEGTKTFGYEIWEQLGRIPANILVPVGNGTLLLGLVRGLEDLLRAGLIGMMPQIIAVQAAGCDPLLRAAEAGDAEPAAVTPEPTLAEGIAVGAPMRGAQILALARRYGVRFVHAEEDEIVRARAELASRGVCCEYTAAANLAAYWRYRRRWGPVPDCLTTMCGAGLKSGR